MLFYVYQKLITIKLINYFNFWVEKKQIKRGWIKFLIFSNP